MANCCFLTIHCSFDSEEWAVKYGETMVNMWRYAKSVGHMAYRGDSKRYLADADISTNGTEVDITGWTKWSLEHEQALNVIGFAKYITDNHLVMMIIDYCETSACIYGKYTYTRGVSRFDSKRDDLYGVVVDRYIPDDEWPEFDRNGEDVAITKGGCTWTDEVEALNDILQTSGKEETVHECL